MADLLRIDFQKGELITPKKRYVIQQSLSMKKYKMFEKWQAELAYGLTFQDICDQDVEQLQLFNQQKTAEAISITVNRKEILRVFKEEENPAAWRIAGLFMIGEDEDPKKFDEKKLNDNINDWEESGVDYQDVFRFAVSVVPGLLTVIGETSRIFSRMAELMEQKESLESDKSK